MRKLLAASKIIVLVLFVGITPVQAMELNNKANAVEDQERLFDSEYVVVSEKAAIRSGAGSSYELIEYVYKDDIIQVRSIKNGWAKVNWKGRIGYIKTTALRKKIKVKLYMEKKDKIILLIEDDFDIRNGIRILLESQGYEIIEAKNGREGLKKLNETISLVILDIIMPEMSGIEVCKKIRESWYVPILFLTAKSSETDKLEGFSAGGDDYLVKPFSYVELMARVKSLLRRCSVYNTNYTGNQLQKNKWLHYNSLDICMFSNSVKCNGKDMELTEKEYQILKLLASYPDKVFSVENIFESVWQEVYVNSASNTVMVHIKNLRSKMKKCGNCDSVVKTVWGKGYRFEENIPQNNA